jgi:hypothetical protein
MFRVPLIVSVMTLTGCGETLDTTYADFQLARAEGAVERGWIPGWTPRTAVNIFESHKIDTGESMLAASYDESERLDWRENCEQVGPFDLPQPPFRRDWWPSDVPASAFSTYRHVFLQCGDASYAAFGQGEFYYWRRDDA